MNCNKTIVSTNVADTQTKQSVEDIWHCRFGHLRSRNLEKLAQNKLVNGLNYDPSRNRVFCQPCVDGKIHKKQFPTTGGRRANKLLELIHSDVCGKVKTSSLGGCHYFLTSIDDNTQVNAITFLPLLMTILSMYGCTF